MDFIRGAALSEGGKPDHRAPVGDELRRVARRLDAEPAAGVVTTRAHVHFVVTEQGIADLFGKNLRQRRGGLIAIAHPAHRDALAAEARRRFGSW